VIARYLNAENLSKNGKPPIKWQMKIVDCPKQQNGCDCGVFTLAAARNVALNRPLTYHQRNVPFLRYKMMQEILQGYLSR
jgi:Ulp1 family protease